MVARDGPASRHHRRVCRAAQGPRHARCFDAKRGRSPEVTGGCTNVRGFFRSILRGPRWEGSFPSRANLASLYDALSRQAGFQWGGPSEGQNEVIWRTLADLVHWRDFPSPPHARMPVSYEKPVCSHWTGFSFISCWTLTVP